jgi:hypothetical protein
MFNELIRKLWIRIEWFAISESLKILCQRNKKEIIRDCSAENNKIKKIYLGGGKGTGGQLLSENMR